jgi:hypothetical protein
MARNDNLIEELKALANRWVLKARDHNSESKTRTGAQDMTNAFYHKGLAEGYHKAALDLATLLKGAGETTRTTSTSEQPAAQSQPAEKAEPEVIYAPVSAEDAGYILNYAGVTPRDLNRHKDNAFTAVFSRWQPISDAERVALIKSADPRIMILESGRLRDSNDPFIDFAFRE